MNHAARQTLDYFRVAPGSVWKWEEEGRVLAWEDGTTLAFREELDVILARLAPQGLPPFAALVILLAASRGKFLPPSASTPSQNPREQLLGVLQDRGQAAVSAELTKLSDLPPELLHSAQGKAFLAATIFEGHHSGLSIAASEQIAADPDLWDEAELNSPAPGARPIDWKAILWMAASGLRHHTRESLLLRLRTGLDARPQAVTTVELPPDQRVRRLLGELSQEPEHAGLARVARDLMAAIRLPTALAEPDELAPGGASGLGNRGPLDRLLLSELAHDDLTLSTRIALNEALYIQREPPALQPEHGLVLVLDAGLRMWGVPRVIAASAALALVAGHRGTGAISVWRPEERSLAPVDLLSRTGLDRHLAILRPELDCRQSLPALARKLTADQDSDVVFLIHRDLLGDPDLPALLTNAASGRGYVLAIDHDGLVSLYPLPWSTARPLAQAQLDLDHLVPKASGETPAPPLIDRTAAGDFPAIFQIHPFPFRLSIQGKIEKMLRTATGGICVGSDRRLLEWEKNNFGARQLISELPGGTICWMEKDDRDRIIVVKGRAGTNGMATVTILHAGAAEPLIARFTGPQHVPAAHIQQDVLLVVLHTRIVVVSLENGSVLSETGFPTGAIWLNGRYFFSGSGIRYASWDGSAVRWDDAISGRNLGLSEIALAFDRKGTGCWILLRNGALLAPDGAAYLQTGHSILRAVAVERGEHVIIYESTNSQPHLVDLTSKRTTTLPLKATAEHFVNQTLTPPTRPVQCRFNAVLSSPSQGLCIRRPKGKWLRFSATQQGLRLIPATEDSSFGDEHPFYPLSTPNRFGCTLQVASWPNGSKAWLDSRGLLHLRSHNPEIPELSLILTDQTELAAWSSDGTLCGNPFFTGLNESTDFVHVGIIFRRFCEHLC